VNGTVKKGGALKIIHDKFRAKRAADEMEKWKASFGKAVQEQKELATFLNRATIEDMNPLKVLDLFKKISDEVRTDLNQPCYNLC
jgi:DNA-directed RNA polymerase III subunit RPC1